MWAAHHGVAGEVGKLHLRLGAKLQLIDRDSAEQQLLVAEDATAKVWAKVLPSRCDAAREAGPRHHLGAPDVL